MLAESPPLPGDDGARLDEDQNILPAGPLPGQPCPKQSIGELRSRSRGAPAVDCELVAQREDLELERDPRLETGAEGGEDGEQDFLHGRTLRQRLRGPSSESPRWPVRLRGTPSRKGRCQDKLRPFRSRCLTRAVMVGDRLGICSS